MSSTHIIGVNLYSVRQHCQTEDDLNRTLERIAGMGYPSVQVSGVGDIAPERIKHIVDRHGLSVCATHENLDTLVNHTDKAIEKLRIFESTYCALGSPGRDFFRPGGAQELASMFKEPAERFAEAGCSLGFHNHHREFERFEGDTFMEVFLKNTEDTPLNLELDVHWVMRGGVSPEAFIAEHGHRIGAIHIKDFAIDAGEPVFAEVGEGNLNWDGILSACRDHRINVFIVEQDAPREVRDIFASLELSIQNMRSMKLL
ncbi:MAG: sugar phosphate isomerase/epimerase family protein [Spirochaetota bacterium]